MLPEMLDRGSKYRLRITKTVIAAGRAIKQADDQSWFRRRKRLRALDQDTPHFSAKFGGKRDAVSELRNYLRHYSSVNFIEPLFCSREATLLGEHGQLPAGSLRRYVCSSADAHAPSLVLQDASPGAQHRRDCLVAGRGQPAPRRRRPGGAVPHRQVNRLCHCQYRSICYFKPGGQRTADGG